MNVIEFASVVCTSVGEKNVCIVMDEVSGKTVKLLNNKGLDLETGMEGRVSFMGNEILCLEPVMAEELV